MPNVGRFQGSFIYILPGLLKIITDLIKIIDWYFVISQYYSRDVLKSNSNSQLACEKTKLIL